MLTMQLPIDCVFLGEPRASSKASHSGLYAQHRIGHYLCQEDLLGTYYVLGWALDPGGKKTLGYGVQQ